MKFRPLTILLMLFLSTAACAKPHQLTWELPILDCDGELLAGSELIEQELVYSFTAMPMPSDTDGPCATVVDHDAPAGALSVAIPATDTSVSLNLQPGQTYFARIRISAYVDGNWSSWSNQIQFTVPYGRPNTIRLSKRGIGQWEYHVLETTELKFFKG